MGARTDRRGATGHYMDGGFGAVRPGRRRTEGSQATSSRRPIGG
ncbi:hypothetical protein SHJG_1481 [Streptomyces hygroscopicus subsp. jinggangensis 5008]|nr:hypothetical protein SHJG_1481 [Streptomyces hygroscopicus subsp. jinggangensis 5008]AGF60978.1 hypothetical protein SHJGH_1312 [Streptomyces hygroscopicus subsp. jinggangensis TL01]